MEGFVCARAHLAYRLIRWRPSEENITLLTHWLKAEGELLLDLLNHVPRHTDGAGFGKLLEPCRYVHPLANPIIALDDHFAEIDADANIDPLVFGQIGIALDETSL